MEGGNASTTLESEAGGHDLGHLLGGDEPESNIPAWRKAQLGEDVKVPYYKSGSPIFIGVSSQIHSVY